MRPSPFEIAKMHEAVNDLLEAIEKNEKFIVLTVGDTGVKTEDGDKVYAGGMNTNMHPEDAIGYLRDLITAYDRDMCVDRDTVELLKTKGETH